MRIELTMDEIWILQDALDELVEAIDQKRIQNPDTNVEEINQYRKIVEQLITRLQGIYCELEDQAIKKGLLGDDVGIDGKFFSKLL